MNNNGKYRDIGEYLADYDPAKWTKRLGIPKPKPPKITPRYERIVKQIKIKDTPQWFCWTCREWHTSRLERRNCPHCGEMLKRNGVSFVAWRMLAL